MRILAIEDERGRLLGYLGSRSDPTADVAAVRELLQRGPLRYRKPSREELEEWRQLSDDGTTIYGARYVPCQATHAPSEPPQPLH